MNTTEIMARLPQKHSDDHGVDHSDGSHDIGGRVRSVLRNSPLRIADAFIHIEPALPEAARGDQHPIP